MTTSVPRLLRRTALAQHLVRLADARRGAEVDAQRAAGSHGSVSPSVVRGSRRHGVERQVQLDDVDARLAEHEELAPVGVLA